MKVSEILYGAADYIDRNGWWQGTQAEPVMRTHRVPGCAGNAIRYAADDLGASGETKWGAQVAFCRHIGADGLGGVYNWNDARERTEVEVTAALRACAVIEAAREDAARESNPAPALAEAVVA